MVSDERFILKNARHLAARYMEEILRPGDIAVDATMGNGKDTQFLCELVGETGHVYAFDVQQEALDRTAARLEEAGLQERATLILAGHETMRENVPVSPRVVMFNLGCRARSISSPRGWRRRCRPCRRRSSWLCRTDL